VIKVHSVKCEKQGKNSAEKKEKEEKAWVSKNKSHFNDIDDFDLSFD